MLEEPRIGVFICHCGGNISDTIDVARVKEIIGSLGHVKLAETFEYMCSNPGQEMIKKAIDEHKLNRVVVASCSPRMHLDTFRQAVKSAGLNSYLLDMINIREHCSWVHDDKEKATSKAIALIRGAVERAKFLEPLTPKSLKVTESVLVIGGGIAGIYSALELADKGYQVYLVERNPSIGGHMAQLSKTFPTFDCSACILTPKMVSVSQHPNIKIFTNAEPVAVKGSPGNYQVDIRIRPRYVNLEKCTACGECARKCPVKKPSKFEENLGQEKAIYIPFKQAIPNCYVIDKDYCLFLTRGICRICERFCKGEAIDFTQQEQVVSLDVGAIIACTGYSLIDSKLFGQYNYGYHPDIVTNLQFERLMLQGLHKPSNGEVPKKIAFILCVGSRSTATNACEYCCKIGCMNAIKHALLLDKSVPGAEPWIFYTDIRAHGKGYEEFYAKAREHHTTFIRGRVAEVVPKGNSLVVKAEDTVLGKQIEEPFDLVVLSPALVPNISTKELAEMLGIDLGPDSFFLEVHHKLRGVETKREGIFIAGCAQGPKDIRETTMESMATASKVATFLGRGKISVSPEVAFLVPDKCNLCGVCIEQCPTKAIKKGKKEVTIDPISCVGCGICVPVCPKEAIDLKHSTEAQLIAQIEGVSREGDTSPKIIAFIERMTAYGSADLGGQSRRSYTSQVRLVGVPSTGRLGIKHLLHAFASGADGVIFVEGDDSLFKEDQLRERIIQLKKDLGKFGIQSLRIQSITTTIPQFEKIMSLFDAFVERISKLGPIPREKREELEKYLKGEQIATQHAT
ncbi:MAG: FAD-dependent oxidoreductase [Candidatus Bathyarchaeia archaeon]|jgi:heterodisulfide reductase subunit A|nr:hydrogenase iron-sulfur subunit [Candidatus Bathyarchaeota archaeon A05DMB-4]MDH7594699.1 FAD-dependent oxidoreductase [Candidatus Bathyarchaeota archaeon]